MKRFLHILSCLVFCLDFGSFALAQPPHDRPIACTVFNDGSSNVSPPSEAIYFAGPETACVPDGTSRGLCRRWFGNCVSTSDNVAVTFKVFDDGERNATTSSGAVYNRAPNVACIPDGTSTGMCRRWFGLPTTVDGRTAQCYLFDDGLTNWIGPTQAIYYRAPGQVCMPDGSATGACRKWFGNCQVTAALGTDDIFTALNAPTENVGLLVDGLRNNAEVDDEAFVVAPAGATASQGLGNMQSSLKANEVLSFSATRAPTRHLTPWTGGNDTFSESMENTVRVPITVWILTAPGTFAAQEIQALNVVSQAGALFNQERLGLDFDGIELRDETNNPNQGTFLNVTENNFDALETQIGHINGRFNVYWVPAVKGNSGNGLGEVVNGDTVAVGRNAAPGLLAHELGHNLALDHVDGNIRFDGTNVMMSAGGTRMFLTEGQAYRAHIRSISAIRSKLVYWLRPAMPIIDTCDINSTTRNCPKADKRIWADGAAWPAN